MPYLVVFKQTSNSFYALKWWVFSLAFIFSASILVVLGKIRKEVSDYDLSKKEERTKFYIVLSVLGFIYLFSSLYFRGIYFHLSIVATGIFFGIVIFTLLSPYIKASIHVAVIAAFVLTLNILFKEKAPLFSLALIPLVGWSRLTLKRHTLAEVIVGGILGSLITIVTFWFGKYIYFS